MPGNLLVVARSTRGSCQRTLYAARKAGRPTGGANDSPDECRPVECVASLPQAVPIKRSEQRKRNWLIFTPACVWGFATRNIFTDQLAGPFGWVHAGIVGGLVYLAVIEVLERVFAFKAKSRPLSG